MATILWKKWGQFCGEKVVRNFGIVQRWRQQWVNCPTCSDLAYVLAGTLKEKTARGWGGAWGPVGEPCYKASNHIWESINGRMDTNIRGYAVIGNGWSNILNVSQIWQRKFKFIDWSVLYIGDQMKSAPLCSHLPWASPGGRFQTYFAEKSFQRWGRHIGLLD